MRADVQKMIENEGVYLAHDPTAVQAVVILVSRSGLIFSMKVDAELDPDRFFDRTTLHGPFWPEDCNLFHGSF